MKKEISEDLKKELEAWEKASIEDWINFEKKLKRLSKKK